MKDWFLVAFACGAGITLGKVVVNVGVSTLDDVCENLMKRMAAKGDKRAQETCHKLNISYKINDDDAK